MSSINAKDFIAELIFCLREEDIVKAKALLQFASDSNISADIQKKTMNELAKGSAQVVLPLLEYLTQIEISNPTVQETLYELILDKAYGDKDLVIEYITNKEKKARLLFLKAAGELLLTDTAPALKQILSTDKDPHILMAAIQSLGAFRLPEFLDDFARMAGHPDKGVRKAAIFAISETGNQASVDRIMGFLGEDEETNKLAVEALSEMQEIYALEKLTSLLGSSITIVRDTAIDQILKLGNKSTPILTKAFQNAQADYLVHLITTLGYIGDPAAISPILDIINTQPKDANIRQAAYEAMERIPSPKTAISLAHGLQDPIEAVRLSAARAIDKNLSKPLVAGLKNIIRTGSLDSQMTVSALIDADAGNIFNFLAEEESFQSLARHHITQNADPATQKAFLKKMLSLGHKNFVADITKEISSNGSSPVKKVNIIVVDDSKMMLKLYQNKLSALGFEPQTFDRPEDAIPQILATQPDMVITDLNMPNISGLELTREIRKKFTRQELPILMITTQSDFVEEEHGDIKVNDSILTKSGINKILHKPFTDDDFKQAISQFLS
ncbi:MAG: response regulator [Proteobacteria bacterium]|nr:response regulator [Desulfobacula sp.]MBU3951401.1 response regulator [Pseudomonadota bacterium]MBU4131967.1 response regulator [Pseudomonadota bacterium]